jgi:hypothetical protein
VAGLLAGLAEGAHRLLAGPLEQLLLVDAAPVPALADLETGTGDRRQVVEADLAPLQRGRARRHPVQHRAHADRLLGVGPGQVGVHAQEVDGALAAAVVMAVPGQRELPGQARLVQAQQVDLVRTLDQTIGEAGRFSPHPLNHPPILEHLFGSSTAPVKRRGRCDSAA